MDVSILNPFLTAMFQLLDNLETQCERGSIQGIKPPVQLEGLTIDIGVIGDISGKFLISVSPKTALFLANRLGKSYGMLPPETFGPMEKSAFQEISNIIGGLASSILANSNLTVNITPPTIIEGSTVDTGAYSRMVIKIPIDIKEAQDRMGMNLYVSIA